MSEKLEKVLTVNFKKTRRTEGGDKAAGSFEIVPGLFQFSSGTPEIIPQNRHSLLEFFE